MYIWGSKDPLSLTLHFQPSLDKVTKLALLVRAKTFYARSVLT